jgi:hypothetical protein
VPKKKGSKQKVTLSIDADIYDQFRQYCNENAIMLSKKVELWMADAITKDEKLKKEGKDNAA